MLLPTDRHYSATHQWALPLPDGSISVGITDFAQEQLGDVMFVQLPEPGIEVKPENACALVESVKSASDVYPPVAGTILTVNNSLKDDPGSVNSDPYRSWFFTMMPASVAACDALLNAAQYQSLIDQEV